MSTGATLANRLLEREPWARERLAAHAGRRLRIVMGPLRRTYAIDSAGGIIDADGTDNPDLVITLSPLTVPALLAQPARWPQLVESSGDTALAATLAELAATLPMLVERGLTAALGPLLGVPLADAGARLLSMPGYAAQRFASSTGYYLAEETHILVGRAEARVRADDIAAMRDAVDALAARVDALSAPPPTRG
jgi:ubiquinone biosynthesis protein UbiJ